jgi:hypothetical protein
MPAGKGLRITGAAAAAEDPQHSHQQPKPLRLTHHAAVAAIREAMRKLMRSSRAG